MLECEAALTAQTNMPWWWKIICVGVLVTIALLLLVVYNLRASPSNFCNSKNNRIAQQLYTMMLIVALHFYGRY